MKKLLIVLISVIPSLSYSQGRITGSLEGSWKFALDPNKVGEQEKWYDTSLSLASLDRVTVPHCFSVDPRYFFYTGTAWYFRKFAGAAFPGHRSFLRFDAVFYRSKIWINGMPVGEHEGGYTPFEFDITPYLQVQNTIAIQVDNSWDTTTIPGAKTRVDFSTTGNRQLYPWMNYGGITRPIYLVLKPDLHIGNVKISAIPDPEKKDASISIRVSIQNSSKAPLQSTAGCDLLFNGAPLKAHMKPVPLHLEAGEEKLVELKGTIAATEVRLWDQDHPNLYVAHVFVNNDTMATNFGIRKVEVRGTQLLLNGLPIKMAGCNRPLDYPGLGSMEPPAVVEKDMQLIKSGSMELSRLNHYPVSQQTLDWADKNGLLIIAEAGNWQLTPKQLADTMMRGKFRSQMSEMIERDWNHPCIIAYSVGNEFQSQTGEGKEWVRDMSRFVKSLDDTRLITFASMVVFRDEIKKPEDEASSYVDFISANIYGGHDKNLQHIHAVYPNKPVFISEFGVRVDNVKTEDERVAYLQSAMAVFRKYDFVIGASVWTFNDYYSRYNGTGSNGYRPWGLVDADRNPRKMYRAAQEEFAPATVEAGKEPNGNMILHVSARKDFPSYRLDGYRLRYNHQTIPIKTLNPGQTQAITVFAPSGQVHVELIKPGGFVILEKDVE